MDKIVRADPYSRQIGFTVEVLGQANLVVQCINARAWKAKVDEKRTGNALLQVLIDQVDIAFSQRRCADSNGVACSKRQINKFDFSFLLDVATGRHEQRCKTHPHYGCRYIHLPHRGYRTEQHRALVTRIYVVFALSQSPARREGTSSKRRSETGTSGIICQMRALPVQSSLTRRFL